MGCYLKKIHQYWYQLFDRIEYMLRSNHQTCYHRILGSFFLSPYSRQSSSTILKRNKNHVYFWIISGLLISMIGYTVDYYKKIIRDLPVQLPNVWRKRYNGRHGLIQNDKHNHRDWKWDSFSGQLNLQYRFVLLNRSGVQTNISSNPIPKP